MGNCGNSRDNCLQLKSFVHFTESHSSVFYFVEKIKITIYGPKMIAISQQEQQQRRTWFWFLSFVVLIADNYRSIASELCSLAKSQGSRDNISVIVVYLKEPHLIATQSWPSTIQTKDIMENLNMYEEPPVANPVTMDALGNTNQVRPQWNFFLFQWTSFRLEFSVIWMLMNVVGGELHKIYNSINKLMMMQTKHAKLLSAPFRFIRIVLE